MTNKELIDKIRQEIERQMAFLPTVGYSTHIADDYIPVQNVLKHLLSFLDSLPVEAPEGLDEAAENYGEANTKEEYHTEEGIIQTYGIAYEAFKAGAEWAFGQGVTMNGSVTKIGTDCFLDVDGDQEQMLSVFDNEEEVIVQIRKK